MTFTQGWWSVTTAMSLMAASYAWRLRDLTRYGVARYSAEPGLMALVTALALLVTGTSPWGTTLACGTGLGAQALADKIRVNRNRKQDKTPGGNR